MQCAICREELTGTYFEVSEYRPNKGFRIMCLCSECTSSRMIRCSDIGDVIAVRREIFPRPICQKPLRAFAKPQVDGLF